MDNGRGHRGIEKLEYRINRIIPKIGFDVVCYPGERNKYSDQLSLNEGFSGLTVRPT